ncbi:MAG: hypothetical protein JKY45_05045 [Emcibacter sp.]|nr:hypothetical protein [Emcibacter sp.]
MAAKVKIISPAELKDLHTGTLMTRRAALLKCEETGSHSDRVGYEAKPLPTRTGLIQFKDTTEWQQAYAELKAVLDTRENLPNKKERKAMRQARAKTSR